MAVARRPGAMTAAVYCTVPPPQDPDQTPVDQQEKLCRAAARERGLAVPPNLVFLDTVRARWQPGRTGPGWEALIKAMAPNRFATLIIYRPEWLLRRPADLLALLTAADAHGITLTAHNSRWDLSDNDLRRHLRGRAARAERDADRVSHQARADHARAAEEGRAHGGGLRAFGYAPGLAQIVEHEAATVREIYERYLADTGQRAIARDLNARGITTALGRTWTPNAITRILDAPRYAGIRVFRGEFEKSEDGTYRRGAWPPIVTIEHWERAHAKRQAAATRQATKGSRFYLLTELTTCTGCGSSMVGSLVGTYPMYACTSHYRVDQQACERHISAEHLENLAQQHAIRILESCDTLPPRAPLTVRTPARRAHDGVRVRPATALDAVVLGPRARFAWHALNPERKAAALRYLFTAIHIGPATTRGTFDPSRVTIVPSPEFVIPPPPSW